MSKIGNEKVEVSSTKEMNDLDILNDIMQSEKNNSNNSAYIYYKYEDGKWNINSMYLGFGFY